MVGPGPGVPGPSASPFAFGTTGRSAHERAGGAALVAMVNKTAAELHWPGEDPIGRRVSWGRTEEGDRIWITIVGIVDDMEMRA